MRTKGSILAVCGALFVAAACSSGSSRSGPAPLVEKSFAISQGDAICKQAAADEKQLVDQFRAANPNPTKEAALDFFVTVLLPRQERAIGDIHRLGEPTKDRVPFDDAVRALDKGLSQLKTEISADPLKVLADGTKAFDQADKLFTDYGFKECGKP